jgi:hypothetical protein
MTVRMVIIKQLVNTEKQKQVRSEEQRKSQQ